MKRRNILKLLLSIALILAVSGCGGSSLPSSGHASAQAEQAGAVMLPSGEAGLTVHFIDVGQGDSILAESDGRFMLVDAGENDQADTVVSYLEGHGVETLDYVIGTHPHSDHIGGLDKVIDTFDVGKVILPPVEHTTKTFEDVLDAVAGKGLKLTKPRVGDTYTLGNASFTIIAPNEDYGNDLNNWSVGIRLDYGDNRFVMCGDAEALAEADILKNGIDISAEVLKAGHHGSSTSTSEAFLDKVSPSVAVIQCGKDNSYGHPHKETLEKFKERGIQVYRNDRDGTVVAYCDGTDIVWGTGEKSGTVSGNGAADKTRGTGKAGQSEFSGGGRQQSDRTSGDSNQQTAGTSGGETFTSGTSGTTTAPQTAYILNTNTKKFHLPTCSSAKKIKDENRETWEGDREELIGQGYSPCGQCKP
ncbi:ComEC/Rec2 family competence protein [Enterocloster lavalensis]|uniref:ComEC/Rec2 family competence protein n=1 Tax=Enterocloster lavalensis TaxID=460384 RepID=UPI002A826EC6|nr:ComEC/Rec2 family competence protein [Enterocloster lavalensis]